MTLTDFLSGLLTEENRASVLAHVESCADCRWVLAAGNGAEVARAPSPLRPGDRVSRYVVTGPLGSGAMGVVYAADDPELGRRVALKMLRPEGSQRDDLRQRLLREAQALARLAHPNVVTLYDVGTHGEAVFLAMELVEGITLAEWMREPRSWKEVLRVFLEAGKGLAAAHAAGLVHRDFKPANTLLGKQGRVCVTDFGIAGQLHQGDSAPLLEESQAQVSSLKSLTRTGQLMGTPAYLAPELMQGQRADARSDEFSFCVALHEALFGSRPFQGETLKELAQAARQGKLSPPKREVKVPPRIRRAVLRGLSARPEDRFPTMQALLAALAPPPHRRVLTWAVATATCLLGILATYGVTQRREARCEQEVEKLAAAWSPERRERVRAAFLATGMPYASAAWERLSVTVDAYAAQWRTLRTESCLAAGRDASDITAWQTAACLDTRLWHLAATTEVLEKADAVTVQNAPELTASLQGLTGCSEAPGLISRPQPSDDLRPRVDAARHALAQARAHSLARRYPESIAETSALLEDIKGLDYKPLAAEVLLAHGMSHGENDKPKEAEKFLYEALWTAEAGGDDETVARAWLELVWVVGESLSRPADAEKLVRHAQASIVRLGRERFPDLTTTMYLHESSLRLQQGKVAEAERAALQGLEFLRGRNSPESLRTAEFLHQLGKIRMVQRRDKETLELHLQALEMRKRLLGPDNPGLIVSYDRLASAYQGLGRNAEAIAIWRKAMDLQAASPVPENAILATMLLNFAGITRIEGRLEEARPLLERALAIFERVRGPDHYQVVAVLEQQAMLYGDNGQHDKAIALTTEALKRLHRALGPDTPRAILALQIRAYAHMYVGNHPEARRDLLEALRRTETSQGPGGAGMIAMLLPLSEVALKSHAPKEALEYCERAWALTEKVQSQESEDGINALTCAAEAHLALGASAKAIPLLERAWLTHTQSGHPGDPLVAGKTAYILAKALMAKRPSPDRTRAFAMAEEALKRMKSVGVRGQPAVLEVQAWQRSEAKR